MTQHNPVGRSPPLQQRIPESGVPKGVPEPKWGEALPSSREFRNPGCPKGLRNPNNGGTIFGPLSDLCIGPSSNPAKIRNEGNINFIYLASCVLLLLSGVDLIQQPAQILAIFHRKSRFFESCQDRSRGIQESSESHLEVIRAF